VTARPDRTGGRETGRRHPGDRAGRGWHFATTVRGSTWYRGSPWTAVSTGGPYSADLHRFRATSHRGQLSITVKAMGGRLSTHLVRDLEPGTVVRCPPRGEFVLPNRRPARLLFVTAGSGITAVMAMLRTMDWRAHAARTWCWRTRRDRAGHVVPRRTARTRTPARRFTLPRTVHPPRRAAVPGRFPGVGVPDWREREAWVCGPNALLGGRPNGSGHGRARPEPCTWSVSAPRSPAVRPKAARCASPHPAGGAIDGATTLMQAANGPGVALPSAAAWGHLPHLRRCRLLVRRVRPCGMAPSTTRPPDQ